LATVRIPGRRRNPHHSRGELALVGPVTRDMVEKVALEGEGQHSEGDRRERLRPYVVAVAVDREAWDARVGLHEAQWTPVQIARAVDSRAELDAHRPDTRTQSR